MSYFIVLIGNKPDLKDLDPIEVIPVDESLSYVNNCVEDFQKQGINGEFWYLDDGCTGTSDEIVRESLNSFWPGESLRDRFLYKVLLKCELQGISIIIWYPSQKGHLNLVKVTDFEEMVNLIESKAQESKDVNLCYLNSKSTIN